MVQKEGVDVENNGKQPIRHLITKPDSKGNETRQSEPMSLEIALREVSSAVRLVWKYCMLNTQGSSQILFKCARMLHVGECGDVEDHLQILEGDL